METSTFEIPTRKVAFTRGALFVRGIAAEDVTDLVRNHLAEMNALFDRYQGQHENPESALAGDVISFAINVVKETPEMVAKLIFRCTEGLTIDKCRKLPLPVQVDTVRAIFELTFEESGGAKKFVDSVMGLVGSFRKTTPELPAEPDSNT